MFGTIPIGLGRRKTEFNLKICFVQDPETPSRQPGKNRESVKILRKNGLEPSIKNRESVTFSENMPMKFELNFEIARHEGKSIVGFQLKVLPNLQFCHDPVTLPTPSGSRKKRGIRKVATPTTSSNKLADHDTHRRKIQFEVKTRFVNDNATR